MFYRNGQRRSETVARDVGNSESSATEQVDPHASETATVPRI